MLSGVKAYVLLNFRFIVNYVITTVKLIISSVVVKKRN